MGDWVATAVDDAAGNRSKVGDAERVFFGLAGELLCEVKQGRDSEHGPHASAQQGAEQDAPRAAEALARGFRHCAVSLDQDMRLFRQGNLGEVDRCRWTHISTKAA